MVLMTTLSVTLSTPESELREKARSDDVKQVFLDLEATIHQRMDFHGYGPDEYMLKQQQHEKT